ncbi:MAG: hypothetical protein GX044_11685 [Firmicutes bacterium]|jgi:hypothetical protein|nr:hypothetical protein [Bacillota bacterium]
MKRSKKDIDCALERRIKGTGRTKNLSPCAAPATFVFFLISFLSGADNGHSG